MSQNSLSQVFGDDRPKTPTSYRNMFSAALNREDDICFGNSPPFRGFEKENKE